MGSTMRPNTASGYSTNNAGSYADYYERVKFLSVEKKWNQSKINEMLSDKKKFEREWNLVSKFIFNFNILMIIL